jgi:hypothetical protein
VLVGGDEVAALAEEAERALGEFALVMFEEDEDAHTSCLSTR